MSDVNDTISNSQSDNAKGYNDIVLFKNNIYAVGSDERIDLIPKSGKIVTIHNSGRYELNCAAGNDEVFIAAGNHGTILYSLDGRSFSYAESNTDKNINGIAYKDGMFIAGSEGGEIFISANGKSWLKTETNAKGNILSLSSNKAFFIGITDAGEIIKSSDGRTWEIQNYNTEYEGYNRFSKFSKVLAIENRIVIIGTHNDGTPSILFSSLGNVWTERVPIYYDDGGTARYLASKPNDVTYDMSEDQFIIACDNGELLSMPSCSKCNKYLKITKTNLNAITSANNSLIIAGNGFSVFRQ